MFKKLIAILLFTAILFLCWIGSWYVGGCSKSVEQEQVAYATLIVGDSTTGDFNIIPIKIVDGQLTALCDTETWLTKYLKCLKDEMNRCERYWKTDRDAYWRCVAASTTVCTIAAGVKGFYAWLLPGDQF